MHVLDPDGSGPRINQSPRTLRLGVDPNSNYDRAKTLVLIRLFVKTADPGLIDIIFYNDPQVVSTLQAEGVNIKTDVEAGNSRDNIHDDHFHLRRDAVPRIL